MTSFKRWNNIVGWAVFAIAALVYLMTMEPVSSLWDCSEFIATSYKLEVGHPPGAPLFMMLARLATLFAAGNPDFVGMAVNGMNSIASAFCILFLFWTITHLARRLVTRDGSQLTRANVWAILGAGIVGALAYTFTDTFWFSAIEGEVYALSSMFTALVVWLMLKWEEEADQPHSSRWIVLIAYMMGLSIGVHILNLLTIPALVFIYYFRTTEKVTFKGIVYATLIAGAARQLGHGALRTGADRRHGLGFVVHTPQRQGRVEHRPALDDHDPHRVLVLRFGDDPCRRQPADEQQQPQQSPRTDVGAQPRPVR